MFVQIAMAVDPDGGEVLYALTDKGIIYEKKTKHVKPNESASGKSEWVSWWSEVNLPYKEPTIQQKQ